MTIQAEALQGLIDGTLTEFAMAFETNDQTRATQAIKQLGAIAEYATAKDVRTLENMQGDLQARVTEMSASASASAAAAVAPPAPAHMEGIDPSAMAQIPPTGLQNAHSNCALLSAAQLLAGAPRLAQNIMAKDPVLRSLFQQVYQAQAEGQLVGEKLGDALRARVGELLARDGIGPGSAYAEWILEGNTSNTKQPDILPVLHALLDAGGLTHQFVTECNGATLIDDETGGPRIETEASLGLDLSGGERGLLNLLYHYFVNTAADSGQTTRKQFITAPDDLVLSTHRYGFEGGGHKIGDNLVVPEDFVLCPEFTQQRETVRYELESCAIHHGADGEQGHYTCLRKVGETWYLANDDDVQVVRDPRPFMAQGYVFHYQKVGAAEPAIDSSDPGTSPPQKGDAEPAAPAPTIDSSGSDTLPPPRTCGEVAARVCLLAIWGIGRIAGMTYRGIQASVRVVTDAKKSS